jgi:hypothetical protein
MHSVNKKELVRKRVGRPGGEGARRLEPSARDRPTGMHRIRDGEVEAVIGVGNRFGAAVKKREVETMLLL